MTTQKNYPTRADWLESRKDWIGASEVPSILGVGFDSPYSLWLKKSGGAPPDEETPEMRRGNFLESGVCDWLECESETGNYDPHPLGGMATWQRGPLQVTPDRITKEGWPVEVKTDGKWGSADEWRKGIPLRHQIQAQAQMWAMDAPRGLIAGLTSRLSLEWRWMEADPTFQAHMVAKVEAFRESLAGAVPPEIDGAEKTWQAVRARNEKRVSERSTELRLDDVLGLYDSHTIADKWLVNERLFKNRIIETLGDGAAEIGTVAGAQVLSWIPNKKGTRIFRVDWKALTEAKQQLQQHDEAAR